MARRDIVADGAAKVGLAEAAMRRAIAKLDFETHPIMGRPVCAIDHDGDVILFDEQEIELAAQRALAEVIALELPCFRHLPDIRLDFVCRQRLATSAAQHVPRNWSQ